MVQNSRQLLARNPFLSCFLIGSGLIILIRISFSGNDGAVAAMLVAAAAIVLLGRYYYNSRVKDLIRAGDELYYLGLLFTLVSLSYALVSLFILSPSATNLEQRTNDLIGSFGIALVSTIVGILARILLQGMEESEQKSPVPSDSDDQLSLLQSEGASGEVLLADLRVSNDDLLVLRQVLREATDAFSHFTRMTLNQAEQTAVHSELLIKDFNERMSFNVERNLEETAVSWRNVVEEIGSQSQQVVDQITMLTQETLERTGNSLRPLAEHVEITSQNIQTQLEINVKALMEMQEQLHSTNRFLNNLASNLETTGQHVDRLGNAATNAAVRMNENSTEIVNIYETFKQGTQQLHGTIQLTDEQAQGSIAKMLELMDSINRSFDTIASNLETAEKHISRLGETSASTVIELNERTDQIINTYKTIKQGAEQQGEVLNTEELRGLIELLADQTSRLVSSLENQKYQPFRLWRN